MRLRSPLTRARVAFVVVVLLTVSGSLLLSGYQIQRVLEMSRQFYDLHRDNSLAVEQTSMVNASYPNPWNFRIDNPRAPSCEPLVADADVDFTLVTQSSPDRLYLMAEHCRRWPHAISLAVANATIHEGDMRQQVADMGCANIRLSFITGIEGGNDYPINALRNLAMSKVTTSHILYVDIDFVVSPETYQDLQRHRAKLRTSSKDALVVPALSMEQCHDKCREQPLAQLVPNTKQQVISLFQYGKLDSNETYVTPFDRSRNRAGHESTNYSGWFQQPPDTLEALPCLTSDRYEPFLVFRYCRDTPPLPEAFTGYGRDKTVWTQLLLRLGWRFMRCGKSFLTHVPHGRSAAKVAWKETKKARGYSDGARLSNEFAAWVNGAVPDNRILPYCPHVNDTMRSQHVWYPHGQC